MISSIFYFADTEQEYLDNFNAHQVKPYTIVFCRDTRTLWKNGVKYGGGDASEVVTTIQSQINDAISAFEQRVNEGSACTTISNRINGAEDIIAEFIAKVTNDSSSASLTSKLNSLSGGVVTNANLEYTVAALVARQEPIITLEAVSSDNAPERDCLNNNPSGVQPLPEAVLQQISTIGDKMVLTGTQFNEMFLNITYYTIVERANRPAQVFLSVVYESGAYGINLTNSSYGVSNDDYFELNSDIIISISIQDLKGEIFSKVDQKIGTATAGLAAKSYVDNKEASILAQVANDISNITITADNITFNAAFINALNAVAEFGDVITSRILASEISANTIDAAKAYSVDSTLYQSHTMIDGDGVRLYNGKDGHVYNSNAEDTDYANAVLKNDGSGHLANGNITWEEDGSVHIGPNGSDGIYIYDDNGTTKIKLQGEIVADNFSLINKQHNDNDGYFVSSSYFDCGLYNGGMYVKKPVASNDFHRSTELNNGVVPSTDTYNAWTTKDWGTIAIGSYNGTLPNPRGINPTNRNDNAPNTSAKLSPAVTLSVKGRDGYGYVGFTGVHNGMNYINGIAVGPSELGDTLFDSTFGS